MASYGLSDVYFGNDNLSDILKTKVIRYNLMEFADTSTNSARIAMSHKSSTSRWFISKRIPLQIYVNSEDCDVKELEAIIARLRLMSQTRWKDLTIEAGIVANDLGDWEYASDILTWHDTRIEDFEIDFEGRIAIVSIVFIADDPIGYADTPQTLFSETAQTGNDTYDLSTIDIQGTFYLQRPKYTLTINSVTAGATPTFSISNGFATLLYDGLIEAGDTFIIDTLELSVLRNGNLVDFDGAMPVIDLEATQELTFEHTYSALNYDILINNQSGYI